MLREKGKRLLYHNGNYIVFDLETTGLSPATDEIIEISAIRVRQNQAADEFSTLVNPHIPIPYAATQVNGITDSMVASAPDLRRALDDFLAFVGNDILVGHNIHTFDTNFLYDGAVRALGRKVTNDYVDTLYLARNCLPALRHHRLTDLAEHFSISTEGAHRALKDCHMNYQCYLELGKLWEEKERRRLEKGGQLSDDDAAMEESCPRCGSPMARRKGRYGSFWGCTNYPMCRYTKNI